MTDRPILFSGPMVRAIIREIEQPGTGKTQTRRVLSNNKRMSLFNGQWSDSYVLDPGNASWRERDVRYAVGDRLWVREAHYLTDDGHEEYAVFAADTDDVTAHMADVDGLPPTFPAELRAKHRKLRPGIHMPRWASRLTLTVTEVRVQRLQQISAEDVRAEGVELGVWGGAGDYRHQFMLLWDSINAKRSPWDSNPWVCAITFIPALGNIDRVAS